MRIDPADPDGFWLVTLVSVVSNKIVVVTSIRFSTVGNNVVSLPIRVVVVSSTVMAIAPVASIIMQVVPQYSIVMVTGKGMDIVAIVNTTSSNNVVTDPCPLTKGQDEMPHI